MKDYKTIDVTLRLTVWAESDPADWDWASLLDMSAGESAEFVAVSKDDGEQDDPEFTSHIGHDVEIVSYVGPDRTTPVNVALECQDCGRVVLDYDTGVMAPAN